MSAAASVIAADLAAWTRLLGHCDDADLRDADPDTLRIWHIPAGSPGTPASVSSRSASTGHGKDAFLTCWQRLCALPAPA